MESSQKPEYIHGHHESVVRTHSWRTVDNSLEFLIPRLRPDMQVLDVGCGPGTITIDLAKNYVKNGKVIGIENAPDILEQAEKDAQEKNVKNLEFKVDDATQLSFADNTFDLVYAHQVLQHLPDPIQALKEMRRVTKPGGIVAVRDADYLGFLWYPELEGLTKWSDLYVKNARANGGDPCAGRKLRKWARLAGYDEEKTKLSSSTWCYANESEVAWIGKSWADRTLHSRFATSTLSRGLATEADLREIADSWTKWSQDIDSWFTMVHGELVYVKA